MVIDGKMLSSWEAMTCSTGTNRRWSGRTTKRDSRGGTLTRAIRSSPVDGVPHPDHQIEGEARDVGKGMALVDGQRGEDGKDLPVEHLDQVGPVVLGRGCPSRTSPHRRAASAGATPVGEDPALPLDQLARPAR